MGSAGGGALGQIQHGIAKFLPISPFIQVATSPLSNDWLPGSLKGDFRKICFSLLRHTTARAFSFARDNAGKRRAARMAMIAITTSNSMSVKPGLSRAGETSAVFASDASMIPPFAAENSLDTLSHKLEAALIASTGTVSGLVTRSR